MNAILGMMMLAFSLQFVSAGLQIDDIYFDPAIVSAGDNVDVVVQYSVNEFGDDNKIANEDYTFDVKLETDDSLSEEYITIVDAKGDSLIGLVFAGQHYNKVFRIKVSDNAPVGEYQFDLIGQWYFNGAAVSTTQSMKFLMDVKKEGIVLGVAGINSEPSSVRAGDDFVELKVFVENAGEKSAKSVEVNLEMPEGFMASYSDNNRVFAGQLNAGESKPIVFNIDVEDSVTEGVYDFIYSFNYKDSNNNDYTKEKIVPFYVRSSPLIEVVSFKGEAAKGSSSKLYVTVRNNGDETAEAVDIRILKQSSQPFDFDVRSDYIGELLPSEEGIAIFDIDVIQGAEIKEYDLKLLIRAKGDSDEGDDNIYVFNDRVKFNVVSNLFNILAIVGALGALGIIGYMLYTKKIKSKTRKNKR